MFQCAINTHVYYITYYVVYTSRSLYNNFVYMQTLLGSKTGGAYIPPAKLRLMQAEKDPVEWLRQVQRQQPRRSELQRKPKWYRN